MSGLGRWRRRPIAHRILAAIDPSGATHRRLIAARILDRADQISTWTGSEIHVGTAWNAAGAEVLRERLADFEWKRSVDETRDEVSADLARALDGRSPTIPDHRAQLVHGEAQDVLPDLVRDREIDLLIMRTLAREGVAGGELVKPPKRWFAKSARRS